ncbi:MAG: CHAT domain-containing protein, partial [Actinomycetota bacterium]|nr:CHAT domain-containing protein [Actinomycetota bacterium]
RLDDAARESEQGSFPTLHRRAAYALARAGRIEEAALVLESGRARALRLRLGVDAADPDAVDRLPAELRVAYLAASAKVALAPLGPVGAPQRRELAEVLAEVRSLPGLTDFATGLHLRQIAAGAARDTPLVYVNPTPWGTLLLTVTAHPSAAVNARLLDRPTGLELYGQLAVAVNFDDPDRNDEEPTGPSYLFAVTGHGDESDYLGRAVEHALGFVGTTLARPIAEQLERVDARSVTLVLCGPLGAVPVGACAWIDDGAEQRLIDRFTVAYAPSGLVAAVARARAAAQPEGRRLVALGDPNGDLDAAGPEIREIVRRFDQDGALAVGAAATLAFLRFRAADATHLHLACHAAGGLFDRDDSLLFLADRSVTIEELTAIDELQPRLVVVSACQGAQSELAGLPEEALSIGAALLAAGAAGAIAALWPVHDAATALLMVRLYEHLDEGIEPPEALRRAQTWLRELTERDRHAFENAHPLLRGELRRLPPRPDDPARSEPLRLLPGTARPFAHPDYWAGFIAMGA